MANHLFMTDAEIAKTLGINEQGIDAKFQVLERSGFPQYDEFFPTRRYWPSVTEFLDRFCDLDSHSVSTEGKLPW